MEFCVGLMNARRIFIHWAAIRLSGDGIARLVTFSELGVLGLGILHTPEPRNDYSATTAPWYKALWIYSRSRLYRL